MSSAPKTFTTKDWLGDDMIKPFPVPSETESFSSLTENDDAPQPDTDESFDDVPETENREVQAVS